MQGDQEWGALGVQFGEAQRVHVRGQVALLLLLSFFPVFFFSPPDGDVKYENAVIATATAPPTTISSFSEVDDDGLSVEPLDDDVEVVEEDDDDNDAWSSAVSPKSGLIMSPSGSICCC